MVEQRNIVILGASFGGIAITHYFLKHILPALKVKKDAQYHVYVLDRSSNWYFRIASPRAAASLTLMPKEKLFYPIETIFKSYSSSDLTFIQSTITGVDTAARKVSYKRSDNLVVENLFYHALIVVTGSNTSDPVHSMQSDAATTLAAISQMNKAVSTAKSVIVAGGGPTGVETIGEIAEAINGKPGWFSTPVPKARITLITSASQLLPELRPAIGKQAEQALKKLGVDVLYNTRVAGVRTQDNGHTTVSLAKGDTLEADLYIPAYGVTPNTSFLPQTLLDERNFLVTNSKTLRVDAAGPRVYAAGDVASFSNNTSIQLTASLPTLYVNLRRDLLSYDAVDPGAKPKGKDREFTISTKEFMTAPIGTGGGVGAIMGWKVPSWFVWITKGRQYLTDFVVPGHLNGKLAANEIKMSKAEAAY